MDERKSKRASDIDYRLTSTEYFVNCWVSYSAHSLTLSHDRDRLNRDGWMLGWTSGLTESEQWLRVRTLPRINSWMGIFGVFILRTVFNLIWNMAEKPLEIRESFQLKKRLKLLPCAKLHISSTSKGVAYLPQSQISIWSLKYNSTY